MTSISPELARKLLLLILLIVGIGLVLRWPGSRRRRIAQRARHAVTRVDASQQAEVPLRPENVRQAFAQRFALLGEQVPMLDAMQRTQLAQKLTRAGFRDRRAVSILVGCKLSAGALLGLGGIALGPHLPVFGKYFIFRALLLLAAFMVGMMIPEIVLNSRTKRRQRVISSALPDALDLLVICTNAGNSLVVGLKRVARELKNICPPLSDEIAVTADELQIGGDSAVALRNMAERIGLPSVRGLVSTLIQSQRYGTPITQSLRQLSRTERMAQMTALEEKAAKLATKITLPMMFFILPTVGLISAGPALIRLIEVFK